MLISITTICCITSNCALCFGTLFLTVLILCSRQIRRHTTTILYKPAHCITMMTPARKDRSWKPSSIMQEAASPSPSQWILCLMSFISGSRPPRTKTTVMRASPAVFAWCLMIFTRQSTWEGMRAEAMRCDSYYSRRRKDIIAVVERHAPKPYGTCTFLNVILGMRDEFSNYHTDESKEPVFPCARWIRPEPLARHHWPSWIIIFYRNAFEFEPTTKRLLKVDHSSLLLLILSIDTY